MTVTEELRRMLDERGIEHRDEEEFYAHTTSWEFMGKEVMFAERADNRLILNLPFFVEGVTPEQAIAATVGEEHEMHICKRCGVAYELNIIDKGFGKPRFCPNCGYRAVDTKELYQ